MCQVLVICQAPAAACAAVLLVILLPLLLLLLVLPVILLLLVLLRLLQPTCALIMRICLARMPAPRQRYSLSPSLKHTKTRTRIAICGSELSAAHRNPKEDTETAAQQEPWCWRNHQQTISKGTCATCSAAVLLCCCRVVAAAAAVLMVLCTNQKR
jgi:hypothetical protein